MRPRKYRYEPSQRTVLKKLTPDGNIVASALRCDSRSGLLEIMSFSKDKARMRRILKACDAPSAIVTDFENICQYRTNETAEDLLREICIRHGFVKPYARDKLQMVVRPYNLGQHHPARHGDNSQGNSVAEQSYRRGYDQGANEALRMMKAGKSLVEIEERIRQIHCWRAQPIQELNALPGCTTPQELPDHWVTA